MINNDDYTGTTYPFTLALSSVAIECYKDVVLISEPIKVTPPFRERMRPRKDYQKRYCRFCIRSDLPCRNPTNNKSWILKQWEDNRIIAHCVAKQSKRNK